MVFRILSKDNTPEYILWPVLLQTKLLEQNQDSLEFNIFWKHNTSIITMIRRVAKITPDPFDCKNPLHFQYLFDTLNPF